MISQWIDWCARNKFLVFTGTLFLVLAGAWALRRVPLDALPDISDVQVVIHTAWNGEPPNIIEDQVTYPISSASIAAPARRASAWGWDWPSSMRSRAHITLIC